MWAEDINRIIVNCINSALFIRIFPFIKDFHTYVTLDKLLAILHNFKNK